MNYFDRTFDTPEANLACDEAMLDLLDEGRGEETLRFWESPVHFAVLGYSNLWRQEIRNPSRPNGRIPVLRRVSGGGTVLQGPGCLNYALILDTSGTPDLSGILSANRMIMERQRRIFSDMLRGDVEVRGSTDLTWNGLKFSGNSQRRKRNAILFHGTFLLDFDLPMIERHLKLPPKQPAYRKNRGHLEFLTNVPLTPSEVKNAMINGWHAKKSKAPLKKNALRDLIAEKYGNKSWNLQR